MTSFARIQCKVSGAAGDLRLWHFGGEVPSLRVQMMTITQEVLDSAYLNIGFRDHTVLNTLG